MSEAGRVWRLGDRIDTDVLAPGSLMKLDARALATHCLKAVRPDFASQVRPGDIVVADEAFGIGSSREQAAVSLKILGVQAVLAKSFARIFFRNAFNQGLPAIICPAAAAARDGDRLSLDLAAGRALNHSTGQVFEFAPIPDHLMRIVSAGGLMPYLKQSLERG
jgi:3-isopropylmalate/(R)-2-methylmalate dehydratase small subunit